MLRHADSTNNPAVRDHDRTISLRGEREAAGIARKLKALGLIPEVRCCLLPQRGAWPLRAAQHGTRWTAR